VLDHDLTREEPGTMHEALPPLAGLKYSANLWLHQYDFRSPNMHGCDMRKTIDRSRHAWPVHDAELAVRTNRTLRWPTLPPSSDASHKAGADAVTEESIDVNGHVEL
jgi:hypothetical protein